jgi:hypothetical protein
VHVYEAGAYETRDGLIHAVPLRDVHDVFLAALSNELVHSVGMHRAFFEEGEHHHRQRRALAGAVRHGNGTLSHAGLGAA